MSSKISPRQRATMLFKQVRGVIPLRASQEHKMKTDYKRREKHQRGWSEE